MFTIGGASSAISHFISTVSQRINFGSQSICFAMSSISLLGSVVWGHHMYTVGLEIDSRAYFSSQASTECVDMAQNRITQVEVGTLFYVNHETTVVGTSAQAISS